jgi:antitoxin (DNA-binding transcriptional repressor) of toxin-antitoxin stability system
MKVVSLHEVKAHFSAIVKDVEAGEVVVVTRHDKPVIEMRSIIGLETPELGAFSVPNAANISVDWTDEELGDLFGPTFSAK